MLSNVLEASVESEDTVQDQSEILQSFIQDDGASVDNPHKNRALKHLTHVTPHIKKDQIRQEWIEIDARGAVLGRLAAIIASFLRGKHLANFTPSANMGAFVVVKNAHQVKVTGRKLKQEKFFWHTGYPGGIKERTWSDTLRSPYPERLLENAVRRMLPRNNLGRFCMRRLKLYTTEDHPHNAQNPRVVDVASLHPMNVRS